MDGDGRFSGARFILPARPLYKKAHFVTGESMMFKGFSFAVMVALVVTGCGQSSTLVSADGRSEAEESEVTPELPHPTTNEPVDGGCGEPVPRPPPDSDSCSLSRPVLRIEDCPTEQGYRVTGYTKPDPRGPELVVLGIYESSSDHSATGEATVHVKRTTPHVLVLSSYEPTRWTLDVAPGARLERVILNGYHAQSLASVPAGVAVENRSEVGHYLSACAYKWPDDNQGCNTQGLMTGLQRLTSHEVTDFAGCYRATQFTVEDGPGSCPPPPPPPSPVKHEAVCTPGQGTLSTYVAPALGSPELHLLGVYESHSNHGGGTHPEGAATVDVTRKAPLILTLSSYEPIHWTVNAARGARIQRIILNGYHEQRVTAPEGIPVENHSGPGKSLGAYAYAWPATSGGSDTQKLVTALESLTSTRLSSFAGCYQGTYFKLGE